MRYYLKPLLFIISFQVFISQSFSQKGKDNSENLSPGSSASYILNRYAALTSGAAAGTSSVTVSNIAQLKGDTAFTNSFNPYTTAAISANDLVMVIQMQGAAISTADDNTYGAVTNYNMLVITKLKTC